VILPGLVPMPDFGASRDAGPGFPLQARAFALGPPGTAGKPALSGQPLPCASGADWTALLGPLVCSSPIRLCASWLSTCLKRMQSPKTPTCTTRAANRKGRFAFQGWPVSSPTAAGRSSHPLHPCAPLSAREVRDGTGSTRKTDR